MEIVVGHYKIMGTYLIYIIIGYATSGLRFLLPDLEVLKTQATSAGNSYTCTPL